MRQYLTHFNFRHTLANNLIGALFEEDGVFPEIVLHFCKEYLLLLISEVRWGNTGRQIIGYIGKPW